MGGGTIPTPGDRGDLRIIALLPPHAIGKGCTGHTPLGRSSHRPTSRTGSRVLGDIVRHGPCLCIRAAVGSSGRSGGIPPFPITSHACREIHSYFSGAPLFFMSSDGGWVYGYHIGGGGQVQEENIGVDTMNQTLLRGLPYCRKLFE